MTVPDKVQAQMPPDEPTSACYQNSHLALAVKAETPPFDTYQNS